MRVVVIGGGVAGLAAAHRLCELDPGVDVTVLEAGDRAGGLVSTERVGDGEGFVIEHGPDAILTEKPAALRLAERLGLADRLVPTRESPRGAYVVTRGRLERVPEGFALLAPTRLGPFLRSPVLSWPGKLRALLEPLVPRRSRDDESLASFVSRRLGREVLDRLAQPLVSGIYGAPPERLSLGATMPRFLAAEREHGSVIGGLRRRAQAAAKAAGGGGAQRASGARYGLFVSFDRGLGVLPEALVERLGDRVQLESEVVELEREEEAWRIRVRGRRSMSADAVILAIPAWRAADLVRDLDPQLAGHLDGIRYGSSATVTLAWPRDAILHPMDAFGFVVPLVERRAALASTWASVKWPERAPDGHELIRVFLGGPGRDDVVEWNDRELEHRARYELRALMGIAAAPELVRVDRYARSMPHYEVGHAHLVDGIEARAARH
ncbi:MAG: protoporphyrinogen oxidase, partial [Myxococcota bacterium]